MQGIQENSNGDYYQNTNNNSRKLISIQPYGGTVGIGTSIPNSSYTLDVSGTANISGELTIGTAINDSNKTGAYQASIGNVSNIHYVTSSYGDDGALLAVGDGTYTDQAVIASFSRGDGETVWEIAAQAIYHTRGSSDTLKITTSSSQVWFGNSTRSRYIKFLTDGSIKSTVAIGDESDDRIKTNEKLIVNATETLQKLTPQTYYKYDNFDLSGVPVFESGLIAQEIYYNAVELRHLVSLGSDYLRDDSGNAVEEEINRTYFKPTPEEMDLTDVDIANDPDYGNHGWSKTEPSAVNYTGLIPYLIKAIQELAERLQEEKEKTATLEPEVTTLKTQMSELLARVSSLETNNSTTTDASDNTTSTDGS